MRKGANGKGFLGLSEQIDDRHKVRKRAMLTAIKLRDVQKWVYIK